MNPEIGIGYSRTKGLEDFNSAERELLERAGFTNGQATVAKFISSANFAVCKFGCERYKWELGSTVREPHTNDIMGDGSGLFSETFGGEYMGGYFQQEDSKALLLKLLLRDVVWISDGTRQHTHIKASRYDVISVMDRDDPESNQLERIYAKLRHLSDEEFFDLQRTIGKNARSWQDVIDLSKSFFPRKLLGLTIPK